MHGLLHSTLQLPAAKANMHAALCRVLGAPEGPQLWAALWVQVRRLCSLTATSQRSPVCQPRLSTAALCTSCSQRPDTLREAAMQLLLHCLASSAFMPAMLCIARSSLPARGCRLALPPGR